MSEENLSSNDLFPLNQSSEGISNTAQEGEIDPKGSVSLGMKVLLWLSDPSYTDKAAKSSSQQENVLQGLIANVSIFSDPSLSWWGNLLLSGFVIAVLSGFIELISLLWRPLGMIFYGIYFLSISYLFFGFLILDANRMAQEKLKTVWTFRTTLILTVALIICFGQMSKYLYLVFGGFAAKQTGYLDWLRFGTEQVTDNALFDLLSIYDWHISTIQATSFWSRTVVFLFNIELEILIIAVIVLQFKRLDLLHFVKSLTAGSIGGTSQKWFSQALMGILNAMIGIFVGSGFIGLIVDIVLAVQGHSPAWWIWTITIGAIPVGGIFGIWRDDFKEKMKQ